MAWFRALFSSSCQEEDFLSSEVETLEEEVHTATSPYCGNLACWCHTDVSYHVMVMHPEPRLEEVEVSYAFFGFSPS